MALSASTPTGLERAWSIGPVKVQVKTFSVANGDTSGSVTFDSLSSVKLAFATGVTQTAAITYSGNVATLTFADPTATRYGQIIAIGN